MMYLGKGFLLIVSGLKWALSTQESYPSFPGYLFCLTLSSFFPPSTFFLDFLLFEYQTLLDSLISNLFSCSLYLSFISQNIFSTVFSSALISFFKVIFKFRTVLDLQDYCRDTTEFPYIPYPFSLLLYLSLIQYICHNE